MAMVNDGDDADDVAPRGQGEQRPAAPRPCACDPGTLRRRRSPHPALITFPPGTRTSPLHLFIAETHGSVPLGN